MNLVSRSADHVVQRLQRQLQHLPAELCRTLTWDRGHEMAAHHAFTVATNIPVYFCDPQSPWQRGTNENTNGLLRQYFPKTTDLSRIPQRRLNEVALELNNRPRALMVAPQEQIQAGPSIAALPTHVSHQRDHLRRVLDVDHRGATAPIPQSCHSAGWTPTRCWG